VPVMTERPRVTLPEDIREQLQKRLGFGRFGRNLDALNGA